MSAALVFVLSPTHVSHLVRPGDPRTRRTYSGRLAFGRGWHEARLTLGYLSCAVCRRVLDTEARPCPSICARGAAPWACVATSWPAPGGSRLGALRLGERPAARASSATATRCSWPGAWSGNPRRRPGPSRRPPGRTAGGRSRRPAGSASCVAGLCPVGSAARPAAARPWRPEWSAGSSTPPRARSTGPVPAATATPSRPRPRLPSLSPSPPATATARGRAAGCGCATARPVPATVGLSAAPALGASARAPKPSPGPNPNIHAMKGKADGVEDPPGLGSARSGLG
jgi:hypothetical protein